MTLIIERCICELTTHDDDEDDEDEDVDAAGKKTPIIRPYVR